MNARELLRKLRKQPFESFVVVTSGGDRHEIRHPENAHLVEGGTLYVFHPLEAEEAEAQSPVMLSVLHITSLEPLAEKAA